MSGSKPYDDNEAFSEPKVNPFLTPDADKYWAKLDNEGTPVTKEELLDRIRRAKRNKGKKRDQ